MKNDWQTLTALTQGEELVVERVRLIHRGITLEGEFQLPALCRLPLEDQLFASAFLRCHGSIKEMERLFGISYPTVKNRLNRIADQLHFVDINPPASKIDVLDQLGKGEITVEQAEKLLRGD